MRTTSPEIGDLDRLAAGVAAYGLEGNGNSALFSIPSDIWPPLIATLYDQRLTGFAVAAAEEGLLNLSSGQAEELLDRHRNAMLQVLALERHLITLSAVLEDAGIEMVLLKGSALAHTVYPDPSWRPFADLDFLVRGEDFQRAWAVLADHGFRRALPEPRAGFDVRFGKAAELTGDDGLTIDLHRTLVVGPFGLWIDLEELFERTTTFSIGGRTLRRLDDTSLFLHACVHASLGLWPPRLMPVRDVAQVSSYGEVNWDLAAERTRRWRLAAVVRHAVETASATLGAAVPKDSKAVLALQPRRRERRALEAYTTDRRQRGGTATATLRAIPSLWGKIAYARALLFPNRDFLAQRQGGRFRRLAIPVRWLTGRRRPVS